MSRLPLVPLLGWAAALAASGAEERPPIFQAPPPAAASEPSAARAVSPAMAAHLAALAPAFVPPSPATPAPAERGEVDKPRNGIVRLPQYLVRERPIPDFPLRRMLTPRGRVELALKRHPGLNFGPLAFLNVGWGLAMLEEEERLERLEEMHDLVSLLPRSSETQTVKREMNASFDRE